MRIICFDLDGTLLDNRADFPSAFAQVLREMGIDTEHEQLQQAPRIESLDELSALP